MKIVIVGAGIAGLAIGWRLAQAGMTIEIIERDLAGRGATWASAGMLAPIAELGDDASPLARLAHTARVAWPAFANELEAASGHDIGFRADGSLTVAHTSTQAQSLERRAAGLRAAGMDADWLGANELRKRETLLSPKLLGALHAPLDAQVDNRALGAAFCAALASPNVELRENCLVRSLLIEQDRACGVVTSRGNVSADAVILAGGAWMNRLGGGETLPRVKPVKGQMAALLVPIGAILPRPLIWGDDIYLVPRGDRMFLGATVEDAGYDMSVTAAARDRLLAAARQIIPELATWSLSELWAGLRPRVRDDLPVLGAGGIPGLFMAGGQFRNGILFAPVVADILCRHILGRTLDTAMKAFDPMRFAARHDGPGPDV